MFTIVWNPNVQQLVYSFETPPENSEENSVVIWYLEVIVQNMKYRKQNGNF